MSGSEEITIQTVFSGSMIRELRRWRQKPLYSLAPDRWSDWARNIVSSYGPLEHRIRSLGFSLRSRGRSPMIHQQFYRIVSITLRRTFRQTIQRGIWQIQARQIHQHMHHTIQLLLSRLAWRDRRRSISNVPEAAMAAHENQYYVRNILPTPKSVLRISGEDDRRHMLIPRLSRIERNHEASQALVRRVVQQTQRIEEIAASEMITRRSALIVSQEMNSAGNSRPASSEQDMEIIPAKSQIRMSQGIQKETNIPDINIDQITDQVMYKLDGRVNAWKERMGKI